MKHRWTGLLIIAAMWILGTATYGLMPAQMPGHWNVQGEVDGYMSRFWGVWLLPLITLGTWLLLQVVPRLDPRRENYPSFAGTYRLFINMLVIFLAGLYAVVLAASLGWNMPIHRVIAVGVGLLFMVIGNELGRVQPNFFVGIRTPWTLADPEVWRQTHRVGGRATVAVGLLNLIGALVLPEIALIVVIIVGTLGFTIFTFAYSYVIWRRLRIEHPNGA